MKEGWEIKKLGEVCKFVRGPFGGSLKKECFVENGYAVYEQQHAIYNQFEEIRYFIDEKKFDEMKRFELLSGDLIMSCSGTMGKVAIVPNGIQKGIINQALLKLTPKNNLIIRFLRYWMSSEDFQISISLHSQGAAIKNVASVQVLKTISLPCPELSEQKRIVQILDETFEKIDTLKANAERNLQNAKELFQSALTDELKLKEGWEVKKLKEIGNAQTGTTPKTVDKENFGDFIPFIKPADIDITGNGAIRYDHDGLSEKGLRTGRKMVTGSILMVCIGATIGKVGFVDRDVSCNQQINSLTVKEGFSTKFIYYALSTKAFFDQVLHNAAQATLPIINKGKWETLTISFPKSIKVQQSIVDHLDALSAHCKELEANYQKTIAQCDEMKKAVLGKAFRGEL
jgi:type I restriction enzyme S subunit